MDKEKIIKEVLKEHWAIDDDETTKMMRLMLDLAIQKTIDEMEKESKKKTIPLTDVI